MAAAMKEIVLVTLAIDTVTGEADPTAPFMVNSHRRGPVGVLICESGAVVQSVRQ
jgi:hypothetical protein